VSPCQGERLAQLAQVADGSALLALPWSTGTHTRDKSSTRPGCSRHTLDMQLVMNERVADSLHLRMNPRRLLDRPQRALQVATPNHSRDSTAHGLDCFVHNVRTPRDEGTAVRAPSQVPSPWNRELCSTGRGECAMPHPRARLRSSRVLRGIGRFLLGRAACSCVLEHDLTPNTDRMRVDLLGVESSLD